MRVAESYLDRFRTDSSFWMSEISPRQSPACPHLGSWICSLVSWRTERAVVSLPGWGWFPFLILSCSLWLGGMGVAIAGSIAACCMCVHTCVSVCVMLCVCTCMRVCVCGICMCVCGSCDVSAVLSCSVASNSWQPHGLQPTRILSPWRFSRQGYWSELPCPPPRSLPNPGIKPRSPALQADSLPPEPPEKPM